MFGGDKRVFLFVGDGRCEMGIGYRAVLSGKTRSRSASNTADTKLKLRPWLAFVKCRCFRRVFPDNTALYPIPILQLVSRCNLDVGRCAAALQLTLVYFFLAVAHTVGKRRCMQWRIMRK